MAWKTHRSLVIVSATRSSQRILWPGAGISFKAQTSPHEEKFSAIQQLLFTTYLSETGTWNLKLYLSLRVWIWYFHKNNGFALNKGTFSFPFPFPPPPLWVVCCVLCIFVHSWAVSGFCLHTCGCPHVCVCACRWRPKVSVKNPPPTFFHLLSVKPGVPS